ncbi:MAG: SWIM zinc finger family protein, partial [Chloroflexota bacterium]
MTKTGKLTTITEKQIRAIASGESFARGMSYYQDGSIRRPKQRGNMLYADCQGTSLYHVTAELDRNGIGATSCTCPYDWGGACKHIVALLLTWLNNPGKFQTQKGAADLLAGMNKEQLVEIIETVLRRDPDLYDVIQRKVGKAKIEQQEEMTLASLRSLLRLTLEAHPPEEYDGEDYYDEDYYDEDEDYPRQDWADEEPLGPQLEELLGFARDWIKEGDREQGLAAYQMFIEESLARLKKMHYEDYEVSECANGCARELGKLAQAKKTDAATRQALFEWA